MISRRDWLVGTMAVAHAWAARAQGLKMVAGMLAAEPGAVRPAGVLIESHIHLFAGDPARFPYNSASYKPQREPVEDYVRFVREARINHAVIVHPEPYQDDHRYLEYCLAHEPSPGFFKATCLFDPSDPETPKRMQALVERNPGRIVALRIHETHRGGNAFHDQRLNPRPGFAGSPNGCYLACSARLGTGYTDPLHSALCGTRSASWR